MTSFKGRPHSLASIPLLLLAAWVLFVLLEFFHRLYSGWQGLGTFFPSGVDPSPAPDLLERGARSLGLLRTAAVGALEVGLFWSWGKRCFFLLGLRPSQPILFLCQVALGFFLNNLLWMGSGLCGLWFPGLSFALILLSLVPLARDLSAVRKGPVVLPRPKGWDLALVAVLLPYGTFLLGQDLLPETFYDSLNYFLGIPAYWWDRHGIVDQPLHLLSGYFHGGGLLFMNGFLMDGGEGAKTLAGWVLGGTVLLAWAWAREWGSEPWTSSVLVLSFPLLYLNAWAARVDGLVVFLVLLSFYAVEKAVEGPRGRAWSWWAGLLGGLALSIKPTALVFILGTALCLLMAGKFRLLFARATPAWTLFGALEAGPWLVKNLVFTGDPFFPYLAGKIGARPVPALGYQRLLQENQQFLSLGPGFLAKLSLPWRMTMPGDGDGQFLGPLLLASLPVLLVLALRPNPRWFLARLFWVTTFLGLSLSHMLRFSLPVLVLGLLLAGTAGSGPLAGFRSLWRASVLASALLCFPEFLSLGSLWTSGGPYWTGREDRSQYLARRLGRDDMDMVLWANTRLPADARILLVGDARALYYERSTLTQSVFDGPLFSRLALEARDPRAMFRGLRELGITHVIFHQGLGSLYAKEYHQYDALGPAQWRRLELFAEEGLEPLRFQGALGLYRLRDDLGPAEKGSPNPFSLFPPGAEDCLAAADRGDLSGARRMAALFPDDPFWSAQAWGKGKGR